MYGNKHLERFLSNHKGLRTLSGQGTNIPDPLFLSCKNLHSPVLSIFCLEEESTKVAFNPYSQNENKLETDTALLVASTIYIQRCIHASSLQQGSSKKKKKDLPCYGIFKIYFFLASHTILDFHLPLLRQLCDSRSLFFE